MAWEKGVLTLLWLRCDDPARHVETLTETLNFLLLAYSGILHQFNQITEA